MNKLVSFIGFTVLLFITSVTLLPNQSFAASLSNIEPNEEVSQLATSRYVQYDKVYKGKVIPPDTYPYSDSYGYKGTLRIEFFIYVTENNTTSVRYGGTVSCSGGCVAPHYNTPQDK